ncbi:MAG: D-alanyl-D-alanine dipeptidase [Candidatus Riflebacteria bacterium]|nr:D-alanyl-D-alanine dipeptidase [Candidatus Riflebacteria bacterium]
MGYVNVFFLSMVFALGSVLQVTGALPIGSDTGALTFDANKNVSTASTPHLVDLSTLCPSIVVDLRYAGTENIVRRKLYSSNLALLVPEAAKALASAQADLQKKGLGLKIWDAYRPLSVQRALWNICPDRRYVAPPETGSRHNRGASVDVTLVDANGKPVPMPTEYDDFSEKASAFFANISEEARRNRDILQETMTKNGFVILDSEWWHFDFPGWNSHPLLDIDFEDAEQMTATMEILDNLQKAGSRQIVFVHQQRSGGLELIAYEKEPTVWKEMFRTSDVIIGRNGFAAPGQKKEGDGKTPTGIYPIDMAFGYLASIDTRLPYRQSGGDDVWVDDPNSGNYNRWCQRSLASATSFEFMHRKDDLYKFGMVIEYNTDPIIPGAGSAIFFHVWSGPGGTTSGCVATPEEFIINILKWLDPVSKPQIVLGKLRGI